MENFQTNEGNMNTPIPYFKNLDIERYYETDDMIIVEGIAADTSRDIVGDRASSNFIQKLAADLPTRPVYYNHNYKMPQLGVVLDAKTVDNNSRLWAKAGIYKTGTNENIIKGVMDGSLRFFSVGAIGKKVMHMDEAGMPTRVFDDGIGQELTITGVPINPTAAFRVAKSQGSDSDGYNSYEEFCKAVADGFTDNEGNPIDVANEREIIGQRIVSMEESFMKGQGNSGMINPQFWSDHGQTSGDWDNLNKKAAKQPAMSDLRSEGGQLPPQTLQSMIRKAYDESTSREDFINRVEWLVEKSAMDYSKGYGYDRLNGTGMGPSQFTSWGPGGDGGVFAKQIAQEIINIAGKANNQPNYGTHPWDADYLRNSPPQVNFKERGWDDSFIEESVSRAGPESLGPLGQGQNPGVHPLDQEFLKQGLSALPPAAKSNGYVHSGNTRIKKAEDLLGDERFMSFIHHTPHLYTKGQGEGEDGMMYIHRLLHERSETEPNGHFRKAVDESIVDAINLFDFDNPSIESTAVLEHIMEDFNHSDVFHKCLDDDRCIYNELAQIEGDDEEYEKGMPPWLNKDKDGEDDDKKKGHKEPDGDEGKNPKKKSDDDGDEEDDKKKSDDDGDEEDDKKKKRDDDEDEDEEDDDEDMKKSYSGDDDLELDDDSRAFLKAALYDAVRERLESDQNESIEYTKGMASDPNVNAYEEVGGIESLANDDFERNVLQALTTGRAGYEYGM